MKTTSERYRKVALHMEVQNAMKYLRSGLAEIQNISAKNDFYDPLLIYLSGGLERLFKTMICLNFQEKNGRLPNYRELLDGNNGHDIVYLKTKVESFSVPVERSFAEMDYDLITNDATINSICVLLREYGIKARYFNLDIVLGTDQDLDSRSEWEKIETSILKEYYGEAKFFELIITQDGLTEVYLKAHELLVSKIELFLRAITRQFIFGQFSSKSKEFMIEVGVFSDIPDEHIGTTDYRDYEPFEFIRRSE
jgi:hypothetical protein